jgi:AcrR family transcriptional regulator
MLTSSSKPDRRIQRTRELLSEALMALILEKGYDGLTIQEIADRANVSRATFYLHYKDKEDLLFSSMQAVYDDLVRDLAETLPPKAETPPEVWYDARDFVHVAEHFDFYRVMFSERGVWSFITRVQDYLVNTYLTTLLQPLHGSATPVPLKALAHYHAAAQIGLIRWWVLNDMPYTPDQMAQMAYHLFSDGAWRCLGTEALNPQLPLPNFSHVA